MKRRLLARLRAWLRRRRKPHPGGWRVRSGIRPDLLHHPHLAGLRKETDADRPARKPPRASWLDHRNGVRW